MSLDCPTCLAKDSINFIGPGVERVAEELSQAYPDKVVSVMSSDIINSPKKINDCILESFRFDKTWFQTYGMPF